jgi:hypothetical protein
LSRSSGENGEGNVGSEAIRQIRRAQNTKSFHLYVVSEPTLYKKAEAGQTIKGDGAKIYLVCYPTRLLSVNGPAAGNDI